MRHYRRHSTRLLVLLWPLALTACESRAGAPPSEADREEIRLVERERLRALVDADSATLDRLHAVDFQLINPGGVALSKAEYLSSLASGDLDYRAWEAGDIEVRRYDGAAVIRYRDVRFDVDRQGQPVHRGPMYHTNLYERRGGRWQIVWSQASGVVSPPPPGT